MSYIGCAIRKLPPEKLIESADKATEINPANAPNTAGLAPDEMLPRERLAAITSKFWGAGGVRLTVGFLDNPSAELRQRILLHMNAWGAWANVKFTLSNVNPQVRIARVNTGDDAGFWSYLGTDVLTAGPGEPTMNLDSFTMNTPESEYRRVVRHETGHTLGFPHEHRRKAIVDRIDREKAIAFFMASQGWTREEVIQQVLTPFDSSALTATSETDEDSIMCYALPGSIMTDANAVPGGTDIDNLDAQFAATLYPGAVSPRSVWPNGKIYFFKGSQYLRFDDAMGRTDAGFPLPIAGNWNGFPPEFADGIDADVLWTNGSAYYFKGSQYLRFDLATDTVGPGYPLDISDGWPGLWTADIDAAVVWPNSKAYFFKGSEYMRYDIATDQVDVGYPKPIKDNWAPNMPDDFEDGVDHVLIRNNGKAYFFKGSQYVRYDIPSSRVDLGYPKPIAGNWPGLWADGVGRP
jgi:hypothetical protein